MSFQQGLSGLNAAAKQLDVIGNNVANTSTVGFKSSQIQFADVYANSLTGSGASQIGIGVQVADVKQQFTQGTVTSTNNPLDIAINGGGFFRVSTNGVISYTRNGQFQLDNEGYIVTSTGSRLTGYVADASGVLSTGSAEELQINTADLPPQQTSNVEVVLTLDSSQDAIVQATTPFDPSDPDTYHNATSLTIYDSLGNSHILQTFYVKRAANEWDVYAITDPATYPAATSFTKVGGDPLDPLVPSLEFDTSGQLITAMPITPILDFNVTTGATNPQITLDYGGTVQYGTVFSVGDLQQDGYTSGRLTAFDVNEDGSILGRYTNGVTETLGQVVLANFTNPNGLQPSGNNLWSETSASGPALVSTPNSGSLGVLQSSAVEDSNVDLTQELVNMITAQRMYEANSQTIKTQDSILQTLVNLR